ncbi:WecB/TagA/CpsF family glycosyltransferase [Pseudoalteromonas sp. SSM20]|uniref:WecB/TagA/CpsF family glycosyltransferase n=1 Tax=Pseudoalteromonas sp. SSM20 TaxID=3139394 RepID=UPI003BAC609B
MNKLTTNLIELDNCTLSAAISETIKLSRSDKPEYIVTPNIDHLARLVGKNSTELLTIYQQASLNLCDSRIFEKLLKLKGHRVEEVIPGSTLTQELFDAQLSADDRVLIIGGDDEVILRVKNKYTNLDIQHYNPPMGFINKPEEVEKTLNIIERSGCKFVFLAVGSPRQEVLAGKLKLRNQFKGVALCIGASILFLVGEEKRAPKWMQTLHIEWLYRMLQDPKRLVKRYSANALSLIKIYKAL